ncbi:MAG: DoxX family membrane protein [Candidatus Dadabacteria bacterium]|nr:MAG: DoxX family membrane protein [Candidatus Dadabacteria bacterium]
MKGIVSYFKNLSGREYFICALRLYMGVWLLYIGLMKWIGGTANFLAYLHKGFDATWVPEPLTTVLGWIILFVEPIIGLWLLSGRSKRLAFASAADFFFLLVFGQTILKHYDVVANNWQYVVLAMVGAFMSEDS